MLKDDQDHQLTVSCPQCGQEESPTMSFCSACGSALPTPKSTKKERRRDQARSPGILSLFFTPLFSLFFIASLLMLMFIIFLQALHEYIVIPSLGALHEAQVANFFSAWYPIAFAAILVMILFVILVILNRQRIRRIFATSGISLLIAGFMAIFLGLFSKSLISFVSLPWQDMLISKSVLFKEFTTLGGLIFVVLGALCLSIYSCIVIVKGKKHETSI